MMAFIGTKKELQEMPIRCFAKHLGMDRDTVMDMIHHPLKYTEEELKYFRDKCDEFGYYPNVFSALINNSSIGFPAIQISGNYSPYLGTILTLNLPVFITLLPEHFIHKSFKTNWILICGKMPDDINLCLGSPVTILDGPKQYIFSSITTNNPIRTAEIFCGVMRKSLYHFYSLSSSPPSPPLPSPPTDPTDPYPP
jgi:hypothetical protein